MTKNQMITMTKLQSSLAKIGEPAGKTTISVLRRRFTFHQDNDPNHTAKATLGWCSNKNVKPSCLWHSQSMMLSGPAKARLESHWEFVEKLEDCCSSTRSIQMTDLEQICKEEWENIPKSRCVKLIETWYPRRLEAVIAAKGASAKYWLIELNIYWWKGRDKETETILHNK